MVKLLFVAILALSVSYVKAVELPASRTPVDALDHIMRARHVAQERAGPDSGSDELRQSARELEELLALLDKEPYREFSSQSKWLFAEYLNISLPLAEIYARLGERDKALQALDISSRVILLPSMAGVIEAKPDLSEILCAGPEFVVR